MQQRHERQIEEAHQAGDDEHDERTAQIEQDYRQRLDDLHPAHAPDPTEPLPPEHELRRVQILSQEAAAILARQHDLRYLDLESAAVLLECLEEVEHEQQHEIAALTRLQTEETARHLRDHEAAKAPPDPVEQSSSRQTADPERDRLITALAERQQEEIREMQERQARQIEEAHRASAQEHEAQTAEAAEHLRIDLDHLPQAPTAMDIHRQQRIADVHVTNLTHEQELLGIEMGVDSELRDQLRDIRREHDQEIEAMNRRHEEEAARYLREHDAAQRLSEELRDRQQVRDQKLDNDVPKRTR